VLQFIQCLLKMSLNDVNKLGTIAYQEVVHVKRAFHTGGYTTNSNTAVSLLLTKQQTQVESFRLRTCQCRRCHTSSRNKPNTEQM